MTTTSAPDEPTPQPRKRAKINVRVRKPILPEPESYTRVDQIYKEDFLQQIYNYSLLGASREQLAQFFGTTTDNIQQWMRHKPGVADAISAGREIADIKVVKALHKRATGYMKQSVKVMVVDHEVLVIPYKEELPPSVDAIKFWLTNRQPEHWKNKVEQASDPDNPINPPQIIINPVRTLENPRTIDSSGRLVDISTSE